MSLRVQHRNHRELSFFPRKYEVDRVIDSSFPQFANTLSTSEFSGEDPSSFIFDNRVEGNDVRVSSKTLFGSQSLATLPS
jgi:hypothetical protein